MVDVSDPGDMEELGVEIEEGYVYGGKSFLTVWPCDNQRLRSVNIFFGFIKQFSLDKSCC